MYLQKKTK